MRDDPSSKHSGALVPALQQYGEIIVLGFWCCHVGFFEIVIYCLGFWDLFYYDLFCGFCLVASYVVGRLEKKNKKKLGFMGYL